MKRISVLIAAMAVSLVGVMSIGAGAASADVLCSTWQLTNGKGCEDAGGTIYPAGTELKMVSNSPLVVSWSANGQQPELTCQKSSLSLKVENPGSVFTNVATTVTGFTLASCDQTATVTSLGSASIQESPVGTSIGSATLSGTGFSYFSRFFGATCKMSLTGLKGELVGPVWNKKGASTLSFHGVGQSSNCFEMNVSASYIFTSPTSVYAAQF